MPIIASLLRRSLVLLWLAFLVASAPPSWAQDAAQNAAQTTPEPGSSSTLDVQQLEELVGTLEDPAARERFVKELKTVIAAQKAMQPQAEPGLVELPPPETLGAQAIFAISAGIRDLSENIMDGVSVVQKLPDAHRWVEQQLSQRHTRNFWLGLLTKLVLVVVGGYVAEVVARRLLLRPYRRLESTRAVYMPGRMLLAFTRAVLDLLPILAFAAVAYALLPLTGSGDRARYVVLAVVNSHILVGTVLTVARLLLAPRAPTLRLLRFGDETAAYLFIWVRRLAAITIYGYFFAEVVTLLGAAASGQALILKIVGLITVAMLIVLVMQNRKIVSDWLRGRVDADDATAIAPNAFGLFRRRFADVWHVLVAIYLAAFYVVWILDIGFVFLLRATALTIVVLALARLLILACTKIVERAFRVGRELTLRYPGLEARANRYLPAVGRALRIVIYVMAALLILQAWGVQSLAWLTSPAGVRFIGTALGILVVVTLALILWEMINLALDRYGARVDATSRSSARVRTLLPLLRTIIVVTLVIMVGLVVLSQIGINITPLLAGAGVIGVAVGFGSQKLVQDVINGMFILAEDTISVGDVVNLDGRGGLVENMTIRYIRLRDFDGSVWTIPFSEVKAVLNMTKDYSRYVLNVEVAYKEDVDTVIEVLKQLGAEMQEDPEYASLILEPIEVVGLDSFGDSSMVIKARITTLPIKQWSVGREFNRRLKKRFDEMGIEIPFPTRTIYYGREKDVPVYQDQATLPDASKGPPEVRGLRGAAEAAD